jgi:hypothetical protein
MRGKNMEYSDSFYTVGHKQIMPTTLKGGKERRAVVKALHKRLTDAGLKSRYPTEEAAHRFLADNALSLDEYEVRETFDLGIGLG